ncbi:MAG TPA: dienelactone hydrolase family protein [Actinomycetota bacterium]|nr:dienelactone hydrolase family protein [Actinomycetota bacterium]
MAEVLLFHHAHGLTRGVVAFADELRAAGHVVHTPDLYDGRTFDDLDGGVAHAQELGMETVLERGRAAAEGFPAEIVYAGFSLGALPAQLLAQTRPGAAGALLLHACERPEDLGGEWPAGVPLQIYTMEGDEWVDLSVARSLAESAGGELFVYPGNGHLFADATLPDYDEGAAAVLRQRVLSFLEG